MSKYIYQRVLGKMAKYEQINDNTYLNIITGMTMNKDNVLLYGKISENIIDLIEVGDIIEIQTELGNKYKIIISDEDSLISIKESLKNWILKSIVTKEQFESMKLEV